MTPSDTTLFTPLKTLSCPLCAEQLIKEQSHASWGCSNGHTFDVAKQGYVNLLPVQHKRSKDPGDSKAMVRARADFLAAHYYQPLADKLATIVLNGKQQNVLDAGCGEGYYLRELLAQAEQRQQPLSCAGLDISKWAVQAAAKSEPRVTWIVASNSQLPRPDQSIDTLLCLFGFPVSQQFKRVLKPGGRLIMVDPAQEHLIELKHIIYPQVNSKPEQLPVPTDTWQLLDEQRLTFTITLNQREHIQHLLAMTPHFYRATNEGRARAEGLEQITVTADMWVRTFTTFT